MGKVYGSKPPADAFKLEVSAYAEKTTVPQLLRNVFSIVAKIFGLAPEDSHRVTFQDALDGKVDRRYYVQTLIDDIQKKADNSEAKGTVIDALTQVLKVDHISKKVLETYEDSIKHNLVALEGTSKGGIDRASTDEYRASIEGIKEELRALETDPVYAAAKFFMHRYKDNNTLEVTVIQDAAKALKERRKKLAVDAKKTAEERGDKSPVEIFADDIRENQDELVLKPLLAIWEKEKDKKYWAESGSYYAGAISDGPTKTYKASYELHQTLMLHILDLCQTSKMLSQAEQRVCKSVSKELANAENSRVPEVLEKHKESFGRIFSKVSSSTSNPKKTDEKRRPTREETEALSDITLDAKRALYANPLYYAMSFLIGRYDRLDEGEKSGELARAVALLENRFLDFRKSLEGKEEGQVSLVKAFMDDTKQHQDDLILIPLIAIWEIKKKKGFINTEKSNDFVGNTPHKLLMYEILRLCQSSSALVEEKKKQCQEIQGELRNTMDDEVPNVLKKHEVFFNKIFEVIKLRVDY